MKKMQIKLISDLYTIIDLCNGARTTIKIHQGHSTIDGKSILGILSLNWMQPVEIEVANGDYEPFKQFLIEE